MEEKIYVTKPVLPPIEEYTAYLERIWDSNILTNFGPLHEEFRRKLTDMLGVEYCLPTINGHTALELAIQGMGLSGEVITTPFTFASTTHAIVKNGLTPVFCDICEEDATIDVSKIEELMTARTCAIVPVHVYGMPCDVFGIEEIAKKYKLKVIYDGAHAFGESINGRSMMSFGDLTMMSFHATKAFHTIEGGCIAIHDANTALKMFHLSNFGIMGPENVVFTGGNAKMNEFQAAMGLCNLNHFEENVKKRKLIFEKYFEELSNVEGIRFLKSRFEGVEFNYTYCPIFIEKEKYGIDRDVLADILKQHEIYSRKYFYPLTNKFACYKNKGFRGDTPIAEKMSKQVLTIPIYPDLDLDDVERICRIIKEKK